MLGYVSLGTNDIGRACGFYDELLSLVGAKRIWEDESFVAWSNSAAGGRVAPIRKKRNLTFPKN